MVREAFAKSNVKIAIKKIVKVVSKFARIAMKSLLIKRQTWEIT